VLINIKDYFMWVRKNSEADGGLTG
jgi:hypothetical protein